MNCVGKIARSIAMNCKSPLVGGYTGRGVLIEWDDVAAIVQDTQNARKVLGITLAEGAKVCALDNAGLVTPLEGSNTTGGNDAGYTQFVKTLSARILSRGAVSSAELVEPLVKSVHGYLAVLEKQDKVGDGSYEVVGLTAPLRMVDPASIVRNENENGGAVTFSLQASEHWFESTLVPTPVDGESQWHASKKAFDELFATAYPTPEA